jgi:hypothetical protein
MGFVSVVLVLGARVCITLWLGPSVLQEEDSLIFQMISSLSRVCVCSCVCNFVVVLPTRSGDIRRQITIEKYNNKNSGKYTSMIFFSALGGAG